MNLLLDTHVILWWLADDSRLGVAPRRAIAEADIAFVSLASAWEVAIKASLGRLRLPAPLEEGIAAEGFRPLPIAFAHCHHLLTLPPLHRDPFDRMLVAQACIEGLTIVTKDPALSAYDVPVLWDA